MLKNGFFAFLLVKHVWKYMKKNRCSWLDCNCNIPTITSEGMLQYLCHRWKLLGPWYSFSVNLYCQGLALQSSSHSNICWLRAYNKINRCKKPPVAKQWHHLFYAKEAFLRSLATFGGVTGFTAFVTQWRLVLSLTTSSLVMAETETPETSRHHHPTSHSTALHPNLEVG